MHSHLDIQVNGKSLVIPDDSSLSVEEKNPMFNDVTFFSYPMQIPVEGNREVLKNIAHRDSDMRAMDLEHADARIFADGLPLNHGQVITQDGSEIKDTFEFNIDAQQQSFSELIGDLECRDVPVKDDICIGEQIGKISVNLNYTAQLYSIYDGRRYDAYYIPRGGGLVGELAKSEKSENIVIEAPQALGFSIYGKTSGFPSANQDSNGNPVITENYINVSQPYPFPYCNGRVSYAHRGVKINSDGTKETDGYEKGNDANLSDIHDYGQYWVLPAERPQSGICFYVLYFLDCLFNYLGVIFNKDELLEVEDLKRLCFFTTQHHCDLRETDKTLNSLSEINTWLSSRKCGGTVMPKITIGNRIYNVNDSINETINLGEFTGINIYGEYRSTYYLDVSGTARATSSVYEMYANNDNFPKAAVSSVISSLENSFGIRFLYDPDTRIVTARLMRNLYKQAKTRNFYGNILSMTPKNEKITGVRMAYSAESDSKEQMNNVRYGVKDYDTDYDYIDFPEERTQENPNGRTITTDIYKNIVNQVSATNNNVYVDKNTGNVYRVKIDSDADDTMSLRPVLFQVGQFKGIEEGDCSERNKDYVKELISNFQPLSVNIINAKDYNSDSTGNVSPIVAPLLDVEMEREYLEKNMKSLIEMDDFFKDRSLSALSFAVPINEYIETSLYMVLSLAESYNPTQTENGNSPLQDIDWGLTVGIMRGGGSGSEIVEYDRGYDGFDNSRWKDVVSIYELTSDSLDPKGAVYYQTEGTVADGNHFSLQIRSWKQPKWASSPLCVDDERDELGRIICRIRTRGLADYFMSEYLYDLLHRKLFKVKVLATIAQLLDIRNHWEDKYVLDGKVGFINALKYNITRANGVSEAELEFYSL